ncbi:MAG: hypothetical protein KatS3mg110_3055 [Pirellulaceae bacterium]|nr:MAG: hypothetical protein KatS3mg110_3055 [Pirellulaceae bacterium]
MHRFLGHCRPAAMRVGGGLFARRKTILLGCAGRGAKAATLEALAEGIELLLVDEAITIGVDTIEERLHLFRYFVAADFAVLIPIEAHQVAHTAPATTAAAPRPHGLYFSGVEHAVAVRVDSVEE